MLSPLALPHAVGIGPGSLLPSGSPRKGICLPAYLFSKYSNESEKQWGREESRPQCPPLPTTTSQGSSGQPAAPGASIGGLQAFPTASAPACPLATPLTVLSQAAKRGPREPLSSQGVGAKRQREGRTPVSQA